MDQIRRAAPLYELCVYLNGTARPDSFKWLLASRLVYEGKLVWSCRQVELNQFGSFVTSIPKK